MEIITQNLKSELSGVFARYNTFNKLL
jgi:hypothetical protein